MMRSVSSIARMWPNTWSDSVPFVTKDVVIGCQKSPTTRRIICDDLVAMVVDVVPRQPVKMVVIREFDGDSLLTGERLDVDYTKPDVDFENCPKDIGVDADHSGRWGGRLLLSLSLRSPSSLGERGVCIGRDHSGKDRGRLLLVGGLVGVWRSGKVWVVHGCSMRLRGIWRSGGSG